MSIRQQRSLGLSVIRWPEQLLSSGLMISCLLAGAVILTGMGLPAPARAHALQPEVEVCARPGTWVAPSPTGLAVRSGTELVTEAARRAVVLLGEQHDNVDHHRWQLQMLAALHARRPDMVIGFEMFPRRLQPVLDRWVAGELGEAEFLRQTDWSRVWGFDAQWYLPMFHFARINRIPMLALNVERALVRQVGSGGWDSVPEAQREGVGRPAPATDAYTARLRETFEMHMPLRATGGRGGAATEADTRFARFLEAQLTWDRAMAELIARRARAAGAPLVVGVMGSGHLQFNDGVPHQLRALGINDSYTMMPFEAAPGNGCTKLPLGLADALFAVPPAQRGAAAGVRLGVSLSTGDGPLRIEKVSPESLAERSGLRSGDRLTRVAGNPAKSAEDLIGAVREQPAGTVLPITVQREGRDIEVLVRFPPRSQ